MWSRIRARAALWLALTSIPVFWISLLVFRNQADSFADARPLIAIFAALALVAIGVGWVVVLSPMFRRIDRAAIVAEMIADGKVDARVADLIDTDEVGSLSRSVDQIAGRIDDGDRARSEVEERLRHQTNHDRLTGLISRPHAVEMLESKLAGLDRRTITLVIIDLDDFRLVNELWGTSVGDEVLVTVASRLRRLVGDDCLVTRWGADEFALIATSLDTATRTSIIAGIDAVFAEPISTSAGPQVVTASVGHAARLSGDTTLDALIHEADQIMTNAKGAVARTERLSPEVARLVEAALEHDSIEVWFQPIVETLSPTETRLVGAEALVRVRSDDRLHLAGDFLSEIMMSRYAREIDRRVADIVFDYLKEWIDQGLVPADFFISLNVSPASLRDADIGHSLLEGCRTRDLDPRRIVLDVSEEAGELDPIIAADLRQAGLRLALDDLGFKRSNFDRLFNVGAEFAKLHRRWLDEPDVLHALVKVCRVKDVQVIAEGVETMDQLRTLHAHGVGYCQGYLISRPIEADAMAGLLAAGRSTQPSSP